MINSIIEFEKDMSPKEKQRGIRVVADGMRYVKPELLDQWVDNSLQNVSSRKGLAVYSATLRLLNALSNGLAPEEVYSEVKLKGFTGRMSNAVDLATIHFHPRGIELKEYLDPNGIRFDPELGKLPVLEK